MIGPDQDWVDESRRQAKTEFQLNGQDEHLAYRHAYDTAAHRGGKQAAHEAGVKAVEAMRRSRGLRRTGTEADAPSNQIERGTIPAREAALRAEVERLREALRGLIELARSVLGPPRVHPTSRELHAAIAAGEATLASPPPATAEPEGRVCRGCGSRRTRDVVPGVFACNDCQWYGNP